MLNIRPYQQIGVEWIIAKRRSALWWEMGLGKTATVLRAAAALLDACLVRQVLIVGTPRIVESVWPAEIAKWAPSLTFTLCRSPDWRQVARAADTDIVLVTYDQLASRTVRKGKGAETIPRTYPGIVDLHGANWPYDVVVLDESSKVKNSASRRHRALRQVYSRIRYLVEMTGTPAGNGLEDLWGQVYLLDKGERLGRTLGQYHDRWFTQQEYGWRIAEGSEAVIHERVADICMSLRSEDYVQLPPEIRNIITVTLPDSARAQYDALEENLFLQLEGAEVQVANPAILTNKCLQAANGAVYVNGSHEWRRLHDAKLDALEDVIEEAAGAPVLVAYAYQSDLERIQQRFPTARVLDRKPETIREWNAGRIPLLDAHPASAGHGLNLQNGGHIIVWFGLSWSLELHDQMNKRLHRPGQTHPVIVHYLIAKNTLDDKVLHVLRDKRRVQDVLIEATKMRQQK